MELDYEKDIQIDPEALDVEWLNQAELMRKYSKHAADMKYQMDNLKERMEWTKAEVEMKIRSTPEAYGLVKVTESAIQSTLLLEPDYTKVQGEYNESRYEYDVAMAAVRAVDQKKNALENLVKLLSLSYFAGPISPRDLSQESMNQSSQKKTNAKVKIQRKKE